MTLEPKRVRDSQVVLSQLVQLTDANPMGYVHGGVAINPYRFVSLPRQTGAFMERVGGTQLKHTDWVSFGILGYAALKLGLLSFMRVNYLISWVWVGAFAIGAISGLVGDAVLDDSNNIWTGWIIQTLPLIIAAQFTIWYPNRLEAHRDGEIPAPTVPDFLATITPWITVIGIVSLSTDGARDWVGIALIVAGILLTKTLSTKDEQTASDTTARSS